MHKHMDKPIVHDMPRIYLRVEQNRKRTKEREGRKKKYYYNNNKYI